MNKILSVLSVTASILLIFSSPTSAQEAKKPRLEEYGCELIDWKRIDSKRGKIGVKPALSSSTSIKKNFSPEQQLNAWLVEYVRRISREMSPNELEKVKGAACTFVVEKNGSISNFRMISSSSSDVVEMLQTCLKRTYFIQPDRHAELLSKRGLIVQFPEQSSGSKILLHLAKEKN